jgi:toxin ParE1/3/4
VSLVGFRIAGPAARELGRIISDSADRFGADASVRYENLVVQSILDLVENPNRIGAQQIDARIHYHLRHSKNRVAGERVRDPRHYLVVKIEGDRLIVLVVVHDAMVEGVKGRIEEGENG